ncbi:MAG: histidinol-phosphatase HisJ family protein [Oscillospiraceae bacterium]|nr:histidinol-phosphatase HisJ family protein [Oscillospiraceae bacterium]MDD4368008.1 histidinol-phosphatase HisJ family protein [Oscillospiraceae bacterium]
MEASKLFDNHNHTCHFSPDGEQTLDQLLQDAQNRGLKGLALTEHFDKDVRSGEPFPAVSAYGQPAAPGEWVFDLQAYQGRLMQAQEKLDREGSGLKLTKGIEVGYLPYQQPTVWRYLAGFNFDTVIASVHCIDNKDIFFFQDAYRDGARAAYDKYLDLIIQMLEESGDFDIVGHFDYVTRYAPGPYQRMTYQDHSERLDRMFRLMIQSGKSLEINTRTRYRLLDKTGSDIGLQDPAIIRRYLELGGELISLSSDSHEDHNNGRFLAETADWLYSLGVRWLCHFEARKAVPDPLD